MVEESKATGRAVCHVGPNDKTAPVQRSLASVVRKFYLYLIFGGQ
jgi:hypothetical protein